MWEVDIVFTQDCLKNHIANTLEIKLLKIGGL